VRATGGVIVGCDLEFCGMYMYLRIPREMGMLIYAVLIR
jgi:hypothetical protein